MKLGIDEVGKGEALGPLIIVGIAIADDFCMPVFRDSKVASPTELTRAIEFIKKHNLKIFIEKIEPPELDANNLNTLLQLRVIKLIKESGATIVYADSPFNTPLKYGERLASATNTTVFAANRLDETNSLVALASLYAKTIRKEFIDFHDRKVIGSGNLNDIITLKFIKANPNSSLIRKKWIRNLKNRKFS